MSRKGESITLPIPVRDKTNLEAIAFKFGMRWGDRPNISKLLQAIAHLLLESGELNTPLRREVEKFLNKPPEIWRHTIKRYIKRKNSGQFEMIDNPPQVNGTLREYRRQ